MDVFLSKLEAGQAGIQQQDQYHSMQNDTSSWVKLGTTVPVQQLVTSWQPVYTTAAVDFKFL